jgi:(2Fe-2S) ferredoxin
MDPKFTAHLFVCTNDRGPGAKRTSCCQKNSDELRDKVKAACREKGFPKGSVRINAAGCLDQCERGIAAVLYPSGRWFLELKNDDASVQALVQAVEQAVRQG